MQKAAHLQSTNGLIPVSFCTSVTFAIIDAQQMVFSPSASGAFIPISLFLPSDISSFARLYFYTAAVGHEGTLLR